MQCRAADELYFRSSTAGGSGLGALKVECKRCGDFKSLNHLVRPEALGKCRPESGIDGGRQPWQRKDEGQTCEEDVRVVQRGDSNLHYPQTISALDIPESNNTEDSETRAELLARLSTHEIVGFLRGLYANGHSDPSPMKKFADEQNVPIDIVEELVLGIEVQEPETEFEGNEEELLRQEEYPILLSPDSFNTPKFKGTSYKPSRNEFGVSLSASIESISLIHRLREVRVFRGFHRVKPGGASHMVPASLSGDSSWLPACEVFGEGIFFQFNQSRITDWMSTLSDRENLHFQALCRRIDDQKIGFLPKPRPELILLHGFAHILIRQLCFECGYASSSLRERIYVDGEQMRGVLIYTADGDSEGTLGGLVRQGESDRLPAVILRALHSASWCSGDPLCRESENQGMAGLNRAACHACLLVSETSCELANALLDRRLLVGNDQGMKGFFSKALEESGVS